MVCKTMRGFHLYIYFKVESRKREAVLVVLHVSEESTHLFLLLLWFYLIIIRTIFNFNFPLFYLIIRFI